MAERTWIHAFTDGRDVSPHSAVRDLAELPVERIATVCGRYYAMDRDQRWERTDRALRRHLSRRGRRRAPTRSRPCGRATTATSRTSSSSRSSSTAAHGCAQDDAAIFFNFRPDRARQLSQRLLEGGYDLTTMTRYRDDFACPVAFEEQVVANTLAEVLSKSRRTPAPRRRDGEVRARDVLLQRRGRGGVGGGDADPRPSPRDVPSYDKKPEMSAVEVADRFARADRRRLPLRGRELRQPRHGRAHGLDSRRHRGRGGGGPLPRDGRRGGARGGRRVFRDRGPRERRDHARARRGQPAHGAHHEPGAADRDP